MKTQLLSYLLEASICIAVFYLFFRLFLQKEVFFSINRAYILLAIILSLLIPVIEIPLQEESPVIQQFIVLQTIPVIEAKTSESISITKILSSVYAGICLLLAGRFGYNIMKLLSYSRAFKKSYTPNYRLILTDGKMPTFSFFRLIFWDNSKPLSEEQQLQILKHELTHIRQWHSLDILFIELVKIIFWFHPAVYLFKNAMQQVHEYLADAAVAKQHNTEAYIQLLVSQILQTTNLSFTHSFHQFPIKNRILMLQKSKYAKPAFWKIALSLPLAIILVFMYACQKDEESAPIERVANTLEHDPIEEVLNLYRDKYPDITINEINTRRDHNGVVVQIGVKNVNDPKVVREIQEKLSPIFVQMMKNIDKQFKQKSTQKGNQVFAVVEQQPSPVGGYEAFYKHIGENIRYPQQARMKGIEGKVFVQFIIRKDGSVSDVKVLKGIGAGCDEEATQVIMNSPKWNPGMQKGEPVDVQMSVPIAFKL